MSYVTIIEVDGYRWETGADNAAVLGGQVSLADGKDPSSATMTLSDPGLATANAMRLPTKHSTIPVDVWLGRYPTPTKVFTGFVTNLRLQGTPTPSIQVMASDKGKKGRRRQKARAKVDVRLDELVRRVATKAGLAVELSSATLQDLTIAQAIQMGETDWEFVGRLLESYGHRMKVRGDTLIVTSEELIGQGVPVDTLTYGVDIGPGWSIDIDERTAATTPNVFDYVGESVGDDDLSDDPALARATRLERVGLAVTADFQPSYTASALRKASAAVAAARAREVVSVSIPATRPLFDMDTDDTFVLRGFGERFSGVYNVKTLSHDLTGFTSNVNGYNGGSE